MGSGVFLKAGRAQPLERVGDRVLAEVAGEELKQLRCFKHLQHITMGGDARLAHHLRAPACNNTGGDCFVWVKRVMIIEVVENGLARLQNGCAIDQSSKQ